ncbi:hypothetical protein EAX62_05590 [Tessaracoccus antarcticus]|uniref:Uncharacterized protein n=1 Tax=Tessaracoccus antarcticus TaxID=2479848 RepID=A0A3M0GXG2_9ACTN|nr:hypothetical protein EAX62_05590 [Tessaracoccus antarcticus]
MSTAGGVVGVVGGVVGGSGVVISGLGDCVADCSGVTGVVRVGFAAGGVVAAGAGGGACATALLGSAEGPAEGGGPGEHATRVTATTAVHTDIFIHVIEPTIGSQALGQSMPSGVSPVMM